NINIIQELKNRGIIKHIINGDILQNKINHGLISLYCGFDPTSDSLHLGHLVLLVCLKYFQLAGHKIIIVIGEATSLIGDPSFKFRKRELKNLEKVKFYIKKIKLQISKFLGSNYCSNSIIILNNLSWFKKINLINFLKFIGKHFSIKNMINKYFIKLRLNNNIGITFTEFSYTLLQGYDFLYLNKYYNVVLQIGGSDQWNNIIAGVNLIKSTYNKLVTGFTLPLILKSDGTKYSKTGYGTIWLDPKKTSPYKFYQFLININDIYIYRYLKLFTLINLKTILFLEKRNIKINNVPIAKYILAEHTTLMVHGISGLKSAQRITNSLFKQKDKIGLLTIKDFKQLSQDGIPSIKVNNDKKINLQQILVLSNLAKSYKDANIIIKLNSIKINNVKNNIPNYVFTKKDKLYNNYTLICRGRKSFCLVIWDG
ncbi:MAG: tyrosine--tRNA ligase, partial [Candidatus Lightella neohaematopini]|nr:tyrosine--tRNA ligase [Candidatus Lightella neohaematopini]